MLQVKEIYNLSVYKNANPLKILTDNLKEVISCKSNEILYICINKILLPRHITSFKDQDAYIPVHIQQAYSKIKVQKDNIDPYEKFGAVVYEHSTNAREIAEIQYYPLIGKSFNKIDFLLDLSSVHNVYENAKIDEDVTLKCPVTIQYTIVKLESDVAMERIIHKSIIIDSTTSQVTYPQNNLTNFRCDLIEPLDTSHETGQPYVQLNSISIPPSVDFQDLLKDAFIEVIATFRPEGPDDDTQPLQDATELTEKFSDTDPVEKNILTIDHEDGTKTAKAAFKIPLFFPNDSLLVIQGLYYLEQQIQKRLDPINIKVKSYQSNKKIRIENQTNADIITIRFSPPDLAAALGHLQRQETKDMGIYNLYSKDDKEYNKILLEPTLAKEASREITFADHIWSFMKHNLFRLAPCSLFIYANFVDETFVHGEQKRLLAVVDTSYAYDKEYEIKNTLIPLYNTRPMIAHINCNSVQHMHFILETSDGKPYPLINSKTDKCRMNLSFRYK